MKSDQVVVPENSPPKSRLFVCSSRGAYEYMCFGKCGLFINSDETLICVKRMKSIQHNSTEATPVTDAELVSHPAGLGDPILIHTLSCCNKITFQPCFGKTKNNHILGYFLFMC